MKKKILVTGGAGFIGLNFIEYLLKKNYKVINIDDLSYAANKKEHNKIKSKRNQEKVVLCLASIKQAAVDNHNLMPVVIEAVENYCTLGEISDTLRSVFGEYQA